MVWDLAELDPPKLTVAEELEDIRPEVVFQPTLELFDDEAIEVELTGSVVRLAEVALSDALLEVDELVPLFEVVELPEGTVLFPIGGPHGPVIIM